MQQREISIHSERHLNEFLTGGKFNRNSKLRCIHLIFARHFMQRRFTVQINTRIIFLLAVIKLFLQAYWTRHVSNSFGYALLFLPSIILRCAFKIKQKHPL